MSPALNVVMVKRSGDVEDFPLLKVMGFVYVVFKTSLFLTDCSECSSHLKFYESLMEGPEQYSTVKVTHKGDRMHHGCSDRDY